MSIAVRAATLADAARLSQLGATTFRETFAGENTPEDMARYLAEAFTPERQAAEIRDPAGAVLLAEQVPDAPDDAEGGAELAGYAHLVRGPAPAAVTGPAPMELKRLYVARPWQGQGAAQALMDAALDAARARGAGTLWLGVWERNPRAVAFYAKYGFTRVGEHTFVLGSDAQTDWLLARPLGPGPMQHYLVIERFRDGRPEPVYARFRERGRLAPEGLHYVSSWVGDAGDVCYQVMACEERALLDEWTAAWDDLVDFEVIPVISSAEAAARFSPARPPDAARGRATSP